MADFKKVVIVGTGLIGGSLGQLIKRKYRRLKIVGVDRPGILRQAVRRQAIDRGETSLKRAVLGADLVVIATPLERIVPVFKKTMNFIGPETLVIDTGSTKTRIMQEIARLGRPGQQFIGGHPLAGREMSGIAAARAEIFRGAVFVLTPQRRTKQLSRVRRFLRTLGFEVLIMPPQLHDEAVAVISHLPYLLAAALTRLTTEAKNSRMLLKLAAGSWLSGTRVAASDPEWGRSVCLTNARPIAQASRKFVRQLTRLSGWLKQKKTKKLDAYFRQAQKIRRERPAGRA